MKTVVEPSRSPAELTLSVRLDECVSTGRSTLVFNVELGKLAPRQSEVGDNPPRYHNHISTPGD